MSWIPRDLTQLCTVQTTITTCQPQTFLFLQLITQLFGFSKDSDYNFYNSNSGFSNSWFDNVFDQTLDGFDSDYLDQPKIEEYDFIVAGAGSAGCVVANRLSEISKWRVLLLEAGGEEPEVADVPAFAPTIMASSIDWSFMTQPDPHSCLARRNGQCSWVRGKVMGGSSVLNFMIYLRGNPRDYDEWAELGNYGWSYEEVLPYFIKSEDNHDHDINPHVHGVGGYQSVERMRYQDENVIAVMNAFAETGLPIFDQSGEHQIGASLVQTTTRNGRRESTNSAFIRPIRRKRRNLRVETNAYVIRVLINPKTKIAYGIEYNKGGKLIRAIARKEVIVSCGSIMSPKVLMLSGIGPADHLQSFGIPVLKNLAVGFNLHDHTTIDGVMIRLTNKTATTASEEQQRQDIYTWKNYQDGPLSSTGLAQCNAFVQTKYEYEHDRADIQIAVDSTMWQDILEDPVLAAETRVSSMAYYNALMMRPVLLNPESRGVLRLNISDPVYGYPIIYSNTFSEQIDLLRMVEGIKQSLAILETKALRKLGATLVTEPLYQCSQIEFGTDEYWACLAQSYTATIYHFCGTCKMGPKEDSRAVVDPELRVYGIKNLRVVDSSIFPKIMRGNTNAPTIMIAEKASDLIKATWLKN